MTSCQLVERADTRYLGDGSPWDSSIYRAISNTCVRAMHRFPRLAHGAKEGAIVQNLPYIPILPSMIDHFRSRLSFLRSECVLHSSSDSAAPFRISWSTFTAVEKGQSSKTRFEKKGNPACSYPFYSSFAPRCSRSLVDLDGY
ncbi:hypothetical protein ASPCADRAFT_134225 [Aspergillus carbonarius ITEM 5010]|uniref:Uncharacterized protein n=1 Tax=Aspergillus carbonarius (strain ITEM 5010) TaxID=602072 RepID=A0A1R3RB15_ASPC5|nr:hypothetical protein ASPCADRAFT_134225 [Aspergillus carbonarius ITEM 5010]